MAFDVHVPVLDPEFQAKNLETFVAEIKSTLLSRQGSYGAPEDSFSAIAGYWSTYLGITLDAEDVGLMMILLKVARQQNATKHDNLVDIAGYAACLSTLP